MNKIVTAFLVFLCSVTVFPQDRAVVVKQSQILEAEPPDTLAEMADITDLVAHVRVLNRKSTLDERGVIIIQYEAELIRAEGQPAALPRQTDTISFWEPGGAFYNGVVLRVDDTETAADLAPSEEYVVFLASTSRGDYNLLWGRYGAFKVVAGFTVPMSSSGHAFHHLYGGLAVQSLFRQISQEIGEKHRGWEFWGRNR